MGLIELCMNNSCFNNDAFDFSILDLKDSLRKQLYYKHLENELRKKHLKIATIEKGILSGAIKVNGSWVGTGIAFELVRLLQEMYGFEYSITVPFENNFGSENEGIFGLVYNEVVDLVAAFLPMTTVYWKYVDFATYLDMGEWIGIIKRPHASGAGWGIFAPFNYDTWFLLVICTVIVGLVIFSILHIYSKFNSKVKKRNTLQDCILFTYGAMLKQGSRLKPISDSSRLMFTTWWLIIILVTAFYTANLTAFLTLSVTKLPIKSTKDIVAKKYSLISKSGNVVEKITNELDPLYNLFKTTTKIFVEENDTVILNKWIRQQHFIYLTEKSNIDVVLCKHYLQYWNTDIPHAERCPFVYSSWAIYKWPRSFAYSKSFQFGPLIDKALRRLVEVGLVKYNFNKYSPVANYCPLNLRNQERPLSNADFLITYYLLICGYLISLFVFLLEIAIFLLKIKITKLTKTRRVSVKRYPMQLDVNEIYLKSMKNFSTLGKKHINGRDYWVTTFQGNTRLIPIGTPSAMIFHPKFLDMCKS